MANLTFNAALGRVAAYAALPAANDALIAVPIETTGIVSDSVMRDYADLNTLLAGASNEQTTMGRKTLASLAALQGAAPVDEARAHQRQPAIYTNDAARRLGPRLWRRRPAAGAEAGRRGRHVHHQRRLHRGRPGHPAAPLHLRRGRQGGDA